MWTLWHIISEIAHYSLQKLSHVYLLITGPSLLLCISKFRQSTFLCLHPKKIKGTQLWSFTDPPIWYTVPPALTEDFKPVTGSVLAQSRLNAPALVQ